MTRWAWLPLWASNYGLYALYWNLGQRPCNGPDRLPRMCWGGHNKLIGWRQVQHDEQEP
jgi:hypothetical protein